MIKTFILMAKLIRLLIIISDENDHKESIINPAIKQETDTTSDQSKTGTRVKRKYNKRTEPKPK